MNLFYSSKVEVSIREFLPNGDIESDLSIVIVVAQVQIFIHVILDHKGLVTIQTAAATVWVKHRGHGVQVMFTERRDEALVKAQFVQEDLEAKRGMKEPADQSEVGLFFKGCVLEDRPHECSSQKLWMRHFIQSEGIHYPVVIHGVGSSFRGRGLLKVFQLLQQLLAEALLKHREAVDSYCSKGRNYIKISCWNYICQWAHSNPHA